MAKEKKQIVNEEFINTTKEMVDLMEGFIKDASMAASSMRGSRQTRKTLRAISIDLEKMGKQYRKLSTSFDKEVIAANKEAKDTSKGKRKKAKK